MTVLCLGGRFLKSSACNFCRYKLRAWLTHVGGGLTTTRAPLACPPVRRGRRLLVNAGSFYDWLGEPIPVYPDWGFEYDVRPDGEDIAPLKRRLDELREALRFCKENGASEHAARLEKELGL